MDSTNGCRSALEARRMLEGYGVRVQVHLSGVTTNPLKKQALQQVGARVYAGLPETLVEVRGY